MPFWKRSILPRDVCKPDAREAQRQEQQQQQQQRQIRAEGFCELADVCGFSLCSVLQQLADLSRHSLGILEELEGDLAFVCRRSYSLEGRLVRLQGRVAELVSKPPPLSKSKRKKELFKCVCCLDICRAHLVTPSSHCDGGGDFCEVPGELLVQILAYVCE